MAQEIKGRNWCKIMKTRIPFLLTGQRSHIIIKWKLHNIALRREREKQMPSKPKFTREEIVEKAPELVAQGGEEALTARAWASVWEVLPARFLRCSKIWRSLQGEVRLAAVRRFEAYAGREMGETPPFKRVGMQMVLFALEQPGLYQLLFLRENRGAVRFDDVLSELGRRRRSAFRPFAGITVSAGKRPGEFLKTCGFIPSAWAPCAPGACAVFLRKRWRKCSARLFGPCCCWRTRTTRRKTPLRS